MSNLKTHARNELEAYGAFSEDGMYGSMLGNAVMELIEVFSNQGHSGMSASIVTSLFSKVAAYKPLGPLTGKDSEWGEVGEQNGKPLFQNKRMGEVFKEGKDGRAYFIDAYIFREPNGSCYTSKDSRDFIDFPCTPESKYIDVDINGNRL